MTPTANWTPACDVEIAERLASADWDTRLAAAREKRARVLAARQAEEEPATPDGPAEAIPKREAHCAPRILPATRQKRPSRRRSRLYALAISYGLGAASVAAAAALLDVDAPLSRTQIASAPQVETRLSALASVPTGGGGPFNAVEKNVAPAIAVQRNLPHLTYPARVDMTLPTVDTRPSAPPVPYSGVRIVVHTTAPQDRVSRLEVFAAAGAELNFVPLALTPRTSSVRFFHRSDAALAYDLATALDIRAESFVGFSPKPERATLEVILAPAR